MKDYYYWFFYESFSYAKFLLIDEMLDYVRFARSISVKFSSNSSFCIVFTFFGVFILEPKLSLEKLWSVWVWFYFIFFGIYVSNLYIICDSLSLTSFSYIFFISYSYINGLRVIFEIIWLLLLMFRLNKSKTEVTFKQALISDEFPI